MLKLLQNNAKELGIDLYQSEEFENITGKGLKTEIEGKKILAGNLALMTLEGVDVSQDILNTYHNLENLSKTIIFLAEDDSIKGILSLSDKIKSTSKRTIDELHKMGVKTP